MGEGWEEEPENEGEMYLCPSLNVPHADGVIIRAGDELPTPGGIQIHGLDGTSVGACQCAVAPATCVQEPNVTLQSEKHVYPRSKPLVGPRGAASMR